MAIPDGHKQNFNTMLEAAVNKHLALVECKDAKTNEPVYTICAMSFEDGEYDIVPLAKLFNGNPYEELLPPEA